MLIVAAGRTAEPSDVVAVMPGWQTFVGSRFVWLSGSDTAELPLEHLAELTEWCFRMYQHRSRVNGGDGRIPANVGQLLAQAKELTNQSAYPISVNGNPKARNATMDEWTTPKLAGGYVGKSDRRIRQLCGTSAFKSKQCGRSWLVELESVRDYYRNQSRKGRRGKV